MSLNPIWDFFERLPRDKSRAMCKQCGSTYSLGSDMPKRQTLTGLKKHMKAHQENYAVYLKRAADRNVERLAKKVKKECSDVDYSNMFQLPLYPNSDLQNGDLTGIRQSCHCCYGMQFVYCHCVLCLVFGMDTQVAICYPGNKSVTGYFYYVVAVG